MYKKLLTSALFLASLSGGVCAEELNNDIKQTPVSNWYKGDYLTGQWFGARPKLEDKGIIIEGSYTNEVFSKLSGGFDNSVHTKYLGGVNLSLTMDMEKMGAWKGGSFFVSFDNLHGSSLSDNYIGDIQFISNLDVPRFTHLSEYYYEQHVLNDKFWFKIGKQDANNDFSWIDSTENFINSSFTLIPNIPLPTYPYSTLGITAAIVPNEFFELKYGLFDGQPTDKNFGFNSVFDGQGGFIHLIQAHFKPEIKGHKGNYIGGFWHNSTDVEPLRTALGSPTRPGLFSSTSGFYFEFDQNLYREDKSDEDNDQGLYIEGQYGWAPEENSEIARYYGASLTYKGLFPYRDNDETGIGMALADISKVSEEIEGKTQETVLEIFHNFQVNKWLSIQPDLQYIFKPYGIEKNALVIGIRTIFNF